MGTIMPVKFTPLPSLMSMKKVHKYHMSMKKSQLKNMSIPKLQLNHTSIPKLKLNHTFIPKLQLNHTYMQTSQLSHTSTLNPSLPQLLLPQLHWPTIQSTMLPPQPMLLPQLSLLLLLQLLTLSQLPMAMASELTDMDTPVLLVFQLLIMLLMPSQPSPPHNKK